MDGVDSWTLRSVDILATDRRGHAAQQASRSQRYTYTSLSSVLRALGFLFHRVPAAAENRTERFLCSTGQQPS